MPKPVFHNDVDYSALSPKEKRIKASRELFTIFFLSKNQGLTDMDIFRWTKKLKFTGYDGMTPDCIVRSNIYRWNDMADVIASKDSLCNHKNGCVSPCSWGFEWGNPVVCRKHKQENMILAVEERLVKRKKEKGCSKGKFYFDPVFAKRVFPNTFSDSIQQKSKINSESECNIGLMLDNYSSNSILPQNNMSNDIFDFDFDVFQKTLCNPDAGNEIPQNSFKDFSLDEFCNFDFDFDDTAQNIVSKNTSTSVVNNIKNENTNCSDNNISSFAETFNYFDIFENDISNNVNSTGNTNDIFDQDFLCDNNVFGNNDLSKFLQNDMQDFSIDSFLNLECI